MDDRRKDPRVPLRAEAEVRFTSWAVFQLIWTVNISQGGMQIEMVGGEPKPGLQLVVKMTLPAGPPLELEAQVKHAVETTRGNAAEKRWQVGVQFIGLDVSRKAAIEQLIRTQGGALPPVTLRKKDSPR